MADLRRAGHQLHAPTLTGLGERVHLARPEVDLSTHIQDIVGVIECEALSDVVLVGSSSSAMVIAGVAERMPERIARLVYIDTIEPRDGQSWFDAITAAVAAPLQAIADKHGQGWRVPRSDVQPPRWVAHPLRTVTQPLARSDDRAARIPRSYVHATDKPKGWFFGFGDVIDAFATKVRAEGWDYHAIASDHLPQLSQPKALAAILSAL
jgi:pimeloyl-ACP methyl ester carboxylesterase